MRFNRLNQQLYGCLPRSSAAAFPMFSRQPRSSDAFPSANRRSASAKSRISSPLDSYRSFGSDLKKLITSAGASFSPAVSTSSSRVTGYSTYAICDAGLRLGSSPIPLAMSQKYGEPGSVAGSPPLPPGNPPAALSSVAHPCTPPKREADHRAGWAEGRESVSLDHSVALSAHPSAVRNFLRCCLPLPHTNHSSFVQC